MTPYLQAARVAVFAVPSFVALVVALIPLVDWVFESQRRERERRNEQQ